MHFWIDKRSQACSFGRPSRVSASLSNSGNYGFGHQPPRRTVKNSQSGPSIHRLNSQDFARPSQLLSNSNNSNNNNNNNNYRQIHHSHRINNRSNNNNNSDHLNLDTNNINIFNNINSNHNSNNNNNNNNNSNNNNSSNSNNNRNSNSNNGSSGLRFYSENHGITQELPEAQNISGVSTNNQFYSLNGVPDNRLQTESANNINHNRSGQHQYSHLTQNNNNNLAHLNTCTRINNLISNQEYSYDINNHENQIGCEQLPNIYGSQTDQAPGIDDNLLESYNRIPSNQHVSAVSLNRNSSAPYTTSTHMIESSEFQLLPTHLKCGMWAALVLASVFVAGAKFYFDHKGNGLEVLIFCAFLATFFLAACTVSLCRLPKALSSSSSTGVDRNSDLENQLYNGEPNNLQTNQYQNAEQIQHENEILAAAIEAPPPYHIAILFPESNKVLIENEEAPPPSYDKILI